MDVQFNDQGTNTPETRKQSIQRCIQSLEHACRCQEQQCRELSCTKMKQVMAHKKICRERANGCPFCKQFIALCCCHAKYCKEVECLVPLCPQIKQKLMRQQNAQSFKEPFCIRQKGVSIMYPE